MSITFKFCESLYCTPITYIILYINYISTLNCGRKIRIKKKSSDLKYSAQAGAGVHVPETQGCLNTQLWFGITFYIRVLGPVHTHKKCDFL